MARWNGLARARTSPAPPMSDKDKLLFWLCFEDMLEWKGQWMTKDNKGKYTQAALEAQVEKMSTKYGEDIAYQTLEALTEAMEDLNKRLQE